MEIRTFSLVLYLPYNYSFVHDDPAPYGRSSRPAKNTHYEFYFGTTYGLVLYPLHQQEIFCLVKKVNHLLIIFLTALPG